MSKRAIFYTVTGTHVILCANSVYSMIVNYTSSEPLEIKIFHDQIYDIDLKFLQDMPALLEKPQITVTIENPPALAQQIDYSNERFPKVVLWRLYVPDLLKNDYDSLIYLDNDTLVYQSIEQLFNYVPHDEPVAAVPDSFERFTAITHDDPGYQWLYNYINSGLLVFNVERYTQNVTTDMLTEFLTANKEANLIDQTAINHLAQGKIKILPDRFNDQRSELFLNAVIKDNAPDYYNYIMSERDNIVIRHFIGYSKNSLPWQHLKTDEQFDADFWHSLFAMKQLEIKWAGHK